MPEFAKDLIWRGHSNQVLTGNPMKNQHRLAKAVDKMFEKFPPAEG
jgi:hypothetical protein